MTAADPSGADATPPPTGRALWAWAFYDWANSAFATTVLAGFFPVFFKAYWSAGVDTAVSTFWLGVANSASSLAVGLMAPLLGAIADAGGARKRYLGAFMTLGVLATAALFLVPKGNWPAAMALFVGAGVGFMGSNVFYDSMIVNVAEPQRQDFASGLGFGLGYLGGGLLFAVQVAMFLQHEAFGFPDKVLPVRVSFPMVAVWWTVFAIPLFVVVRERRRPAMGFGAAASAGFRQLRETFGKVRELRTVALFLVAYWAYIDGVHTVIKMALAYGQDIGLPQGALIGALLLTQFVGFPAAIVFGWLGGRIGPKRGILIGIVTYAAVIVFAYFMTAAWQFFVLATVVGLVQGGIQSLSRSLFASLIPPEQASELFGFYSFLGKLATVLGPLLMGVGALVVGERAAILSLLLLLGAGGGLLWRLDVGRPREATPDGESPGATPGG